MRTSLQQALPRRSTLASAGIAFFLLSAACAHAAATAGSCASAEQKAAGKAAAAQLGCHAKATQKGESVDGTCLQKALDKLAGVVTKADGAGGCLVPGYGDDFAVLVGSLVADVVNATPPGAFAKCAAAKQKTAGKSAAAKLGCHAKASKSGDPVSADCLAKAGDKLAATFAKEEGKTAGGCGAYGVAPTIGARVDEFVARVVNGTPVAPAARCCTNGGASFCADLSAANASQCTGGFGGTLAGPALVCDGASGDCVEARTETATGCCDAFTLAPGAGLCLEGPGAVAQCAVVGGTYHADAKCLPSGGCDVADAPGDTGPWAVGHRQLASVDTSRVHSGCLGGGNDGGSCTSASACPGGSCVNAPAGRSLPLEVWYPVDPAGAFGPFTGYPLAGIVTLPSTLSHENAPVSSAGPRPLVVFSHGAGGIAIQSVHLMERLASEGFVVVAPNHTGNSQFDTTKVCTGGSNVGTTCKVNSECPGSNCAATPSVSLTQALLDRVPDVSFVIDHMTTLATTPGDPFFGRIDGLNVGVAGHSLGGFTALAVKSGYGVIPADNRVQAIMPIAPASSTITDPELANVTVPTLFMTGTLDPLLSEEARAAGLIQSSPFNYRADVIGAVHTHFANICDIANALIAAGFQPGAWPSLGAGALVAPYNATCIPPAFPIDEATRLQNLYATAFFRRHLLGQTIYDPFLTTPYAQANEADIDFIVTP
jgi:predicted dienelactone hydrolase